MFSTRAFVLGAAVAFCVGLVGSLALRPPGAIAVVAQGDPGDAVVRQRWRVPLSASQNLPGSGEAPVYVAKTMLEATGGSFVLDLFDPGEIVPAFAVTDAVRDRKVPAGYTWIGYDQGKIPASALFGATPFGMEPWAYMGWWFYGGGRELADRIYADHQIKPLFCSITGPETAGWFREPIESAADVQGLKIRFAGVGGKVMQRLGASITMLPAGEIFQALETGVIDATEYSQPITDRALGFSRIASYNYYPGWHQPFSASHLVVNLDVWNALTSSDRSLLETVCTASVLHHFGLTESMQGEVVADFPNVGVTASQLPDDLLRELQRTADIVLDEEAAQDADFSEVLASQRLFKENYKHWRRLAYLPKDF